MKMSKTKIFCLWLRNLKNWLLEPKTVYSVVLIIISGILLSFAIPRFLGSYKMPYVKSLNASFLLQIMGTFCVGWEIFKRAGLFSQQRYLYKIISWVKSFPLLKQPIQHDVIINAKVGIASSCGGSVTVTAKSDTTLDERVEILENKLNQQAKLIDEFKNTTKLKFDAMQDLIDKNKTEFDSNIKSIRDQMKELAVGDIKLEIIGFMWLIIGLLLA